MAGSEVLMTITDTHTVEIQAESIRNFVNFTVIVNFCFHDFLKSAKQIVNQTMKIREHSRSGLILKQSFFIGILINTAYKLNLSHHKDD